MQTKSNIQLIRESFAKKEQFVGSIKGLMDAYLIKDSVFSPTNEGYEENVKGYLAVVDEFDTFGAAQAAMVPGMSIRVINNDKFQIGFVYESLSDIHNAKEIYDIAADSLV